MSEHPLQSGQSCHQASRVSHASHAENCGTSVVHQHAYKTVVHQHVYKTVVHQDLWARQFAAATEQNPILEHDGSMMDQLSSIQY